MYDIKQLIKAIIEKKDYTEIFNRVIAEKVELFLTQKRCEIANRLFNEGAAEKFSSVAIVPSQGREEAEEKLKMHKKQLQDAIDSDDKTLANLHRTAIHHLRQILHLSSSSTSDDETSLTKHRMKVKQNMTAYDHVVDKIRHHE